MRLEDRLKAFVVERLFLKTTPDAIRDEDDLFTKWDISSPHVLEIVIGLEEVFGITFGDDEFSMKKFRTIAKIAEAVRTKNPNA
ncbi:MAG TPA: acyl carrier protein [Planctomycetota bacterium]|nr:acyl carrier protein [Planctomycetota bacterium]